MSIQFLKEFADKIPQDSPLKAKFNAALAEIEEMMGTQQPATAETKDGEKTTTTTNDIN